MKPREATRVFRNHVFFHSPCGGLSPKQVPESKEDGLKIGELTNRLHLILS